MLEIPLDCERGFVYGADNSVLDELGRFISLECLSTEVHGGTRIATVRISDRSPVCSPCPPRGQMSLKRVSCVHDAEIEYDSCNLLPQAGWEELIDCWSCHNCEFKSMLGLVPRPRRRGILVSDLFLLVNDEDVPVCCRTNDGGVRKLFYNEVMLAGYDDDLVVYLYLESYFSNRRLFLFEMNGENYEMKYFYKATVIDVEDGVIRKREAMKVGIKRSSRIVDGDDSINDHYISLIYRMAIGNSIDVKILDYDISFIFPTNCPEETVINHLW